MIAQTGTLQANGSLTGEIDSPAVQITADVTGTRSINAMNALVNTPTTTADANVAGIVQQAGIFTGFGGTARPSLQTDGNFTAAAGDVYRLNSLFQASSPSGHAIAGYRVALDGGNGTLQPERRPHHTHHIHRRAVRAADLYGGRSGHAGEAWW